MYDLISRIALDNALNMWLAIIWTNNDYIHWFINVSFNLDKLILNELVSRNEPWDLGSIAMIGIHSDFITDWKKNNGTAEKKTKKSHSSSDGNFISFHRGRVTQISDNNAQEPKFIQRKICLKILSKNGGYSGPPSMSLRNVVPGILHCGTATLCA